MASRGKSPREHSRVQRQSSPASKSDQHSRAGEKSKPDSAQGQRLERLARSEPLVVPRHLAGPLPPPTQAVIASSPRQAAR